jgi:hypothetical protein
MCVSANGQFSSLIHPNFYHCRFCFNNAQNSLDNLERVFPMNLLSILKSFHHIIDEILSHLASEANTIVVIFDIDRIDVQLLKY